MGWKVSSVYGRLNFGCLAIASQSFTICGNSSVVRPLTKSTMLCILTTLKSPPTPALEENAQGQAPLPSWNEGSAKLIDSQRY